VAEWLKFSKPSCNNFRDGDVTYMRKRIVRGRLSYGMADRTLRHMTGEPIITNTNFDFIRLLTGNARTELYHNRINNILFRAKQDLLERMHVSRALATRSTLRPLKKVRMNMNMLTI
jgi:hypothetical protein